MKEIRIGVAIILALFAACFMVMNWSCVIVSERNKRRGIDKHVSTVPLISVILAGLAYASYPVRWIGVIPAVDIGNWIFIIGFPWALAKGFFKKEPPAR